MNILISKAHFPVTVLGYGRRIGIWVQGCRIHCPGCCSVDTWNFDTNRAIDVGELVSWCVEVSEGKLDGITISGGEPFDQPEPLLQLLEMFVKWRRRNALEFDLLLYSGYTKRRIYGRFARHVSLLDALVPEPFIADAATSKSYCGSDNQSFICLTARARVRYSGRGDLRLASKIQVATDKEGIWFIGIPRRGDLSLLEKECETRGLILDGVSWRS